MTGSPPHNDHRVEIQEQHLKGAEGRIEYRDDRSKVRVAECAPDPLVRIFGVRRTNEKFRVVL
jgi:hypothetical protein